MGLCGLFLFFVIVCIVEPKNCEATATAFLA